MLKTNISVMSVPGHERRTSANQAQQAQVSNLPVFGLNNTREGLVIKPRSAAAGHNPHNARRINISVSN